MLRAAKVRLLFICITAVMLLIVPAAFTLNPTPSKNEQQNTKNNMNQNRPDTAYTINFGNSPEYQILPYYLDLNIGEMIRIIDNQGKENIILIRNVTPESRRHSSPRTRVTIDVNGREYFAYCGMVIRHRGGIGPIEVNGIRIGVEITRLVFSGMDGGRSPFNTYRNFRLDKDLRLAVWDAGKPIIRGIEGAFVVKQKDWTYDKYGNWLHRTNYGIHSAIDIYAGKNGIPEEVLSPVNGTVYRVYNRGADKDDERKSKAVNIYGDDIAGPKGEKVLYRFHHFSKILVSDGDRVRKGQVIGLTGHTGFDAGIGDHIHFEIRVNPSLLGMTEDPDIFASVPVNPYNFLLEWWDNRHKGKDGQQHDSLE